MRQNSDKASAPLYRAVWRWHFYASLFVVPFLLALALSGLLMLLAKPVDYLLQRPYAQIAPAASTLTQMPEALAPQTLKQMVLRAYPEHQVQLYMPPKQQRDTARFSLINRADAANASFATPSITLFVNPYSGEILGSRNPADTFYTRVKLFHGSLYLGTLGDRLLEAASGLAVLMVITGLYLALAKRGGDSRAKGAGRAVPNRAMPRKLWRYLHKIIGLVVALPLLFFLFSGLAWTGVWGGKLVQPWQAIPVPEFAAQSHHREATATADAGDNHEDNHEAANHRALNRQGVHQVPWVMEATPLPEPQRHVHPGNAAIGLNEVDAIAETLGFGIYRVSLPVGGSKTWVISTSTSAGDTQNPWAERTVHLDSASGDILADIGFADYPLLGKAMAAGIPLHEAELGLWNWFANFILVGLVVFIALSGLMLWWKRRPANTHALVPPAASPGFSRLVVVAALLVSLLFPLSAALLLAAMVLDWLLISRVRPLKTALK